jgi:N-6 DNA Methylase
MSSRAKNNRGHPPPCSRPRKTRESPSNGPLTKLYKAFQAALIHDLKPEEFADTYAQTITYGLLTAAISRTEMSGGTAGTFVKADDIAEIVPVTNPFLKEMLQMFLTAGGRNGGIDFDELGVQDVVELLRGDETDLPAILRDFGNKTQGEDPVIHFYEHFLSAYNKKLKIQRGVFYTPKPVVSYIVRSVHDLLQTEFGLEDGLASTATWGEMAAKNNELKIPEDVKPVEMFVQILDPATGTATFLVEVIDVIHHTLKAKWDKSGLKAMPKLPPSSFPRQPSAFGEYWNQYVPLALLPRLHGYELMMAPYAIAHMKIGLKLHETGYRFGSDERARIYLTNALEPKVTQL